MRRFLAISCAILLASCDAISESGPVEVAIIGQPDSLFDEGVRLSPAAQHVKAATTEGLVGLDPSGQVVPAIAERWIVTEDGMSYIFRLRNSAWPDGEAITAPDIRDLLRETIDQLEGTSLGLDFAKVSEIRAMTGRVIEVQLTSPMPEFLRLLAQPEMGLVKNGSGAGPMVMSRDDEAMLARLGALPPERRGLPAREDWEDNEDTITVRALEAEVALDAFSDGEVDLVLNGRLWSFPQVELGPLSRGTIQLDPAIGLFGLAFRTEEGFLEDPVLRETLSMAIDRGQLLQAFQLGGWAGSTWIVPSDLFLEVQRPENRWTGLSVEERRDIAARRVARWSGEEGEGVTVSVALPQGPGSDLLFAQLVQDWRTIGVTAVRVGEGEPADLELIDRIARYSSPRWFLNQFHCSLERGLCSPDADALVADSLSVADPIAKEQILAEAQSIMIADDIFIPLGAPVRWSLVRGAIAAYEPNPWGLHPLFPLSQPTI